MEIRNIFNKVAIEDALEIFIFYDLNYCANQLTN